MKQIQIRIFPNGEISAETHGVKGKECLKYIETIEQMTNAVTIDSDFTKEYLELEEQLLNNSYEEVQA